MDLSNPTNPVKGKSRAAYCKVYDVDAVVEKHLNFADNDEECEFTPFISKLCKGVKLKSSETNDFINTLNSFKDSLQNILRFVHNEIYYSQTIEALSELKKSFKTRYIKAKDEQKSELISKKRSRALDVTVEYLTKNLKQRQKLKKAILKKLGEVDESESNIIKASYSYKEPENYYNDDRNNKFVLCDEHPIQVYSTKSKPKLNKSWLYEVDISKMRGVSNEFGKTRRFGDIFKTIVDCSQETVRLNDFCNWIKHEVERINALYNSEQTLLSALLPQITKKAKMKEVTLISIDHREDEVINGEELSFRCDILLKFKHALFVVEIKYDKDRDKQALEAMATIIYRAYSARTINMLKRKKEEILKGLNIVVELGIGMRTQTGIIIEMIASIRKFKDVDLESYKTSDFVKAIKDNSKRNIPNCYHLFKN